MTQPNAKLLRPPIPSLLLPAGGLRQIQLEGGGDVRDLGGYPTGGGRFTKHGVAYRSSSPANLTQADRKALRALGLAAHIDLRCDFEVAALGPADFGDPRIRSVHIPLVDAQDPGDYARRVWKSPGALADPHNARAALYRRLLDEAGPALAKAFDVAATDIPTLHHCSTGRDRTGLLSALLLRVADVPDALIAWDYACGLAMPSKLLAAACEALADLLAEPSRALAAGTPPGGGAPLLAALEHLDQRWGGAESYLITHGVKPAHIEHFLKTFIVASA